MEQKSRTKELSSWSFTHEDWEARLRIALQTYPRQSFLELRATRYLLTKRENRRAINELSEEYLRALVSNAVGPEKEFRSLCLHGIALQSPMQLIHFAV